MFSFAHAATGGLIVTKFTDPTIGLPLVFASHFLLDYIPHWDFGTGINHNKKSKRTAFYQELFIDIPLSIALVYFLFQHNNPLSPILWISWFVSILPDLLEFPQTFLKLQIAPLNKINHFHHGHHHSYPNIIRGLLPQMALLIFIYLVRS